MPSNAHQSVNNDYHKRASGDYMAVIAHKIPKCVAQTGEMRLVGLLKSAADNKFKRNVLDFQPSNVQ